MNWLNIDAPAGWADLLVRTVKVAVIAFVVLQAKEYFDAGMFDTPATAMDSVLVAGGTFIVGLVQKWLKV